MIITTEMIIDAAKIIGALGTIGGIIYAVVKWFQKQEKQSVDIKELHKQHTEDMKNIQEELCVVNYAVLAALDALKQQGYNGGVTEARDKLEKHLNKQAHGQK